jgi:ABC-2 type transport system permease protein
VTGMGRYVRMWLGLARYGLIRELTFRGNFLVKIAVEVLWLGILLIFYRTVFARSDHVASWTEAEFLFYVGCHFALSGVLETFFLENCGNFADLVRTGDLDFYLTKPIDEQFLITCRTIDWSTAPNVLMGAALMVFALNALEWEFDPLRLGLFLVLFVCGVGIAYSFLLMLTASSVWLMRNQSLYEVWWLFTTLMRYPREIFMDSWAAPLGWFFTFVIPIMVVISVPANTMVKVLDPWFIAFTMAAMVVLLIVSRRVFRTALQRYRSASS